MALRQTQPPHTCFYSNKCEWSQAFIKELSTTPYKGEFHFVCIDTTQRGQLPNWLKQVPTLVIKGDEEPIKVNGDVMNWIYERKMKDTSRAPASVAQPSGGAGPGEPEAWNISEMGGKLSESYGVLVDGSGASVESSSSKNFDLRHLFGLLTLVYHWNNAEVGSHYHTRRVPNIFSRNVQNFLNFLTL
jgi:hypothetical protein